MADETAKAPDVQNNTETSGKENTTLISASSVDGKQTQDTIKPEGTEQKTEQSKTESKQDDYSFTPPEGVQFDKGIIEEFSNLAKDLKLPKEQAQKLLDLAVKNHRQSINAHLRVREGWVNEIKTDENFGGDKFNETITRAQRVLRDPEIGSPQLIQLLESTGFGDHPEFIKAFAKIDRKYGEDRAVTGKPSGTTYKSAAEVFYPNSK